jgi:hypothetical protein
LQSASEEEESSSEEEEDDNDGTSSTSSTDDEAHNINTDQNLALGVPSLTSVVANATTTSNTTHSPNGNTHNDATSLMTELKTPTPMIQIQFVMGTNLEEQHPTAMALLTGGGGDDSDIDNEREENGNGQKPCGGEDEDNDDDYSSSCSETNVKPASSDLVNRLLQQTHDTSASINSTKDPRRPPKTTKPLIVEMD